MARYDKYDPISGGFRAALNADWLEADVDAVIPVSLNGSGRVVKGGTGVVGVVVLNTRRYAGDVVDVMTDGECVDVSGLAAGTHYYATSAGALGTTNTDPKIGFTVEDWRLVVRARV